MSTPFVSILLLTHNGMETLPDTIAAIASQKVDFTYEVIAVDSASRDGTVEFLRGRIDRILPIRSEDFNHALTRNLGIEHCSGELVVQLVQDALPVSDAWLQELVAPLIADDSVAGSYARQIPRPDASAVTRYYAERWMAFDTTPRSAAVKDESEWRALSPIDRFLRSAFDDVCSCIRRSVWLSHPFKAAPIAEDLEWGRDVLLAGHRLIFAANSTVVHSHDRPARYELSRTYLVHQRLYALFGLRTIPDLTTLIRGIAISLKAHSQCVAKAGGLAALRQAPRAIALALALPLGQYLGGLSQVKQWQILRPRGV